MIHVNEQKLKKRSFYYIYSKETTIEKFIKQRFLSLCSVMYINNQNIYDTKNFTVWVMNTCCCCCRLFCLININIKYNSKIYSTIMCCDKSTLVCWNWVILCVLRLILLKPVCKQTQYLSQLMLMILHVFLDSLVL